MASLGGAKSKPSPRRGATARCVGSLCAKKSCHIIFYGIHNSATAGQQQGVQGVGALPQVLICLLDPPITVADIERFPCLFNK